MTQFAQKFASALAAALILLTSLATVVSAPAFQSTDLAAAVPAPVLA